MPHTSEQVQVCLISLLSRPRLLLACMTGIIAINTRNSRNEACFDWVSSQLGLRTTLGTARTRSDSAIANPEMSFRGTTLVWLLMASQRPIQSHLVRQLKRPNPAALCAILSYIFQHMLDPTVDIYDRRRVEHCCPEGQFSLYRQITSQPKGLKVWDRR